MQLHFVIFKNLFIYFYSMVTIKKHAFNPYVFEIWLILKMERFGLLNNETN